MKAMCVPRMQHERCFRCALRQRLNVSRAVLAARLRTNPRTLENWEQGRAKPNAQAALLIRLVERYPETMDRLASV